MMVLLYSLEYWVIPTTPAIVSAARLAGRMVWNTMSRLELSDATDEANVPRTSAVVLVAVVVEPAVKVEMLESRTVSM